MYEAFKEIWGTSDWIFYDNKAIFNWKKMILFIMKGEVIVSVFKKFLCAVIVFAISINLFG